MRPALVPPRKKAQSPRTVSSIASSSSAQAASAAARRRFRSASAASISSSCHATVPARERSDSAVRHIAAPFWSDNSGRLPGRNAYRSFDPESFLLSELPEVQTAPEPFRCVHWKYTNDDKSQHCRQDKRCEKIMVSLHTLRDRFKKQGRDASVVPCPGPVSLPVSSEVFT